MKLTTERIKQATKEAVKGRKPLSGVQIIALRNSNRAFYDYKPTKQYLIEARKRKLEKEVEDG